ncbi:fibrous sheath CABYR-binding protein-like [Salvia splendens]|uniref:fibrous sheath CABYR-binding protein-like n=1 Tax=Salvia splendens TaxID=180675 RepID=UPI001C25BB91|nr:fibrous sheath CABYR-binding protein-like [Salvia splendens]
MGKKAYAKKIKPHREEVTATQQQREEPPSIQPPPNPQSSVPAPQAPAMISLNAMAEFLRQQDPTRNWAAELANFSQIGGQGSPTGASTAGPTTSEVPPEPVSYAEVQSEGESPSAVPSEASVPNSADLNAIAAHYDSNPEELEARTSQPRKIQEVSSETEETSIAEPVLQEVVRGEIDLNESAQKRDLMTDEEFDSIMNKVIHAEAVGEIEGTREVSIPEGPAYQSGDQADDNQTREKETLPGSSQPEAEGGNTLVEAQVTKAKETEVRPEVPNPVAPPVVKPKPVKRRLVLKADPKVDRPKPHRYSQRCLGKWAAKKAKPNTAADPLEIVSEDERPTPTKPGEESLPAADPRDSAMGVDEAPQTQGGQGEDTERMAEGLDFASESVEPEGSEEDDTI